MGVSMVAGAVGVLVKDGLLGCVIVVLVGLRGRAAPPPCRELIVRMVFEKFFIFFFFC